MSVAELLGLLVPPGQEVPHHYIKSTLGHGEAMCVWCHGTNRENAVISPNHCTRRSHDDPKWVKVK